MDTGVRAALRQAGAFSESTGSKNEGSLGESMIFGIQWEKNTKICGVIGWEWLVFSMLDCKITKVNFFTCQLFKSWGFEWQIKCKNMGLWVWALCNCKKIWGLWVQAMLKKGVFWPLHTRRLQNGTAPSPPPGGWDEHGFKPLRRFFLFCWRWPFKSRWSMP